MRLIQYLDASAEGSPAKTSASPPTFDLQFNQTKLGMSLNCFEYVDHEMIGSEACSLAYHGATSVEIKTTLRGCCSGPKALEHALMDIPFRRESNNPVGPSLTWPCMSRPQYEASRRYSRGGQCPFNWWDLFVPKHIYRWSTHGDHNAHGSTMYTFIESSVNTILKH
jgi:hypothetical protein